MCSQVAPWPQERPSHEDSRLARLEALLEDLAAAMSAETAAQVLLDHARALAGAAAGAVWLRDGEARTWRCVAGVPAPVPVGWEDRHPVADAAREGLPQWTGGAVVLPLVGAPGSGTLGVVTLEGADGAETQRALRALARAGAQTLERLRLHEAERSARLAAESASRRLRIQEEASRTFAGTLDLGELLDAVARRLADTVGDACMLALLDERGEQVIPLCLHHRRREVEPLLRPLAEASFARDQGMLGQALLGGRPVRVAAVDTAALRGRLPAAAHPYLDRVGLSSMVLVPLRVEGQALGALVVCRDQGGAAYAEEDAALALDLAERAALGIRHAQLYQAAQVAVRVRDEFLMVAGHELRTPLTALQLQLDSVLRLGRGGALSAPMGAKVERAARSAEKLTRLVQQILDVTRISAGWLTLEPEPLDLRVVVAEAQRRTADELADAGCPVVLELGEDLQGSWDRERLQQIVAHLLGNAAKYGRGKPVRVRAVREGEEVHLTVLDQGIGIAPEDQARIFERFERAVTVNHFGGLGLGLWVVRQIAEAHGGRVRVDSQPGAGARFHVQLPRFTRHAGSAAELPSRRPRDEPERRVRDA